MRPPWRRYSLLCASTCALILGVAGCTPTGSPDRPTKSPPVAAPGSEFVNVIDVERQQRLVDALVVQLACPDRDVYRDDLTFWDEMRGYDCVDAADTVSVRAYGSSTSADQILETWAEALVNGRSARRGTNWFLVGPHDRIAPVEAPDGAPEVHDGEPEVAAPLSEQEQTLTNCAQYAFDEAGRVARNEPVQKADEPYYSDFFPGVAEAVRTSLSSSDLGRMRAVDEDRWHSLLSPKGPMWKQVCRTAALEDQPSDAGPVGDGAER